MTRSYKKNSNSIIHGNLLYYSKKGKRTRKDKRTCIFYNSKNQKCKNEKCHISYCVTAKNCTQYKRKKKRKASIKASYENIRYQDQYLDYPSQSGIHESIPLQNVILSKNIGTSCHTEFLKNKDNKRRDKRKCIYNEKINKICNLLKARCPGSSHCKSYHEKEENNHI